MEQTKYVNLPIVGRVQHGEKVEGKGTKELGYFIAKIKDAYMKSYLEKFDKQYKGKQSIDIEIFCENPLTIKYARYNQGGKACYCMENSNMANQKSKNGWQQINCDKNNCQYRQKNEYGKSVCNRIAWFKFLIPSVSKDRIFLMRITGQKSIDRLKDYFNLQKLQGNSLQGNYTLYLKQEEQTNSLCKTYNNYILDIMEKENFISENTIPQITENSKEQSNENDKSENTKVEKEPTSNAKQSATNIVDNKDVKGKSATKKSTVKSKKETENKVTEVQKSSSSNETKSKGNDDLDNYYALLSTFTKTLTDKYGNPKDYLMGEFADSNNKIINVAIKPDDAQELKNCDLGTFVKLEITEAAGNKFAIKLEFIEKCLKKIAA